MPLTNIFLVAFFLVMSNFLFCKNVPIISIFVIFSSKYLYLHEYLFLFSIYSLQCINPLKIFSSFGVYFHYQSFSNSKYYRLLLPTNYLAVQRVCLFSINIFPFWIFVFKNIFYSIYIPCYLTISIIFSPYVSLKIRFFLLAYISNSGFHIYYLYSNFFVMYVLSFSRSSVLPLISWLSFIDIFYVSEFYLFNVFTSFSP